MGLEGAYIYIITDNYVVGMLDQKVFGCGCAIELLILIAYIIAFAQTMKIWGPFLIVAPASTLHNWQQEASRFFPKLKVLKMLYILQQSIYYSQILLCILFLLTM